MSDPRLDELAKSARHRGLKLVRSRVRTPGKRRFGNVGLTDKGGKPVFGMDAKGPVAKPEDVEGDLRNLGAKDWGASLDVAVMPRKHKPSKVARKELANDSEPEPKPKAKAKVAPPSPKLSIRGAKPSDAPRLAELIRELGHEIIEKQVRKNLARLSKADEMPLVATLDKEIVGMCGIGAHVTIHRPAPLGRITALVVLKAARRHGIGRMLIDAAEDWMRKKNCELVEVTSDDRRAEAHAFYRHMGYERTSIRFMRKL